MVVRQYKAKGHLTSLLLPIVALDDAVGLVLFAISFGVAKALDAGTNPPAVEAILAMVKDYCLGYKLPGAGGGGYLYMVAKSPEAAVRIRSILTQNPPNACARFVDMTLSDKGFQVSRS